MAQLVAPVESVSEYVETFTLYVVVVQLYMAKLDAKLP